jgi:hypothetical protein
VSNRPLLVPPRAKTVRIVDAPEREKRAGRVRESPLPTPPPSASKARTMFRIGNVSGMKPRMGGPRVRRRRNVGYGSELSASTWFALGFVLGPWCWMIGGWMMGGESQGRVVGDAEKGERVEGEQWVRRCRIASVVSGVAVVGAALIAVVYAVLGAR